MALHDQPEVGGEVADHGTIAVVVARTEEVAYLFDKRLVGVVEGDEFLYCGFVTVAVHAPSVLVGQMYCLFLYRHIWDAKISPRCEYL